MQPKEHLSHNPESHKDTPAFLEAKNDFHQAMKCVPEDLQISAERIENSIFTDKRNFEEILYESEVTSGIPSEEARRRASLTAHENDGFYFFLREQVIIAAKHDGVKPEGGSQIDKVSYYFSLLAHEFGHDKVPRRRNVSAAEAAALKSIDEEVFLQFVQRQLRQDPNVFLHFLEARGHDPQEFWHFLTESLQQRNTKPETYLAIKSTLSRNPQAVLDILDLDLGDYNEYISAQLESCHYDVTGRTVAIVWGPQQLVVDRLTYMPESLLSELQADAYMHYLLFIRYVQKKYGERTEESIRNQQLELLNEYQKSDEFRAIIGLNELNAVYILEAAKVFRGFERLLRLMIDAQKSTQELSEPTAQFHAQETQALESIVKAGQAQEILLSIAQQMNSDYDFTVSLYESALQIIRREHRTNKQLLARIERSWQDSSFPNQIYKEFDPFTVHELLLRGAKPLLAREAKKGKGTLEAELAELSTESRIHAIPMDEFQKAAQGVSRGSEQIFIESDVKDDLHPLLKIMTATLEKNATRTSDVIIEKALLVIAHNRKMKYSKK